MLCSRKHNNRELQQKLSKFLKFADKYPSSYSSFGCMDFVHHRTANQKTTQICYYFKNASLSLSKYNLSISESIKDPINKELINLISQSE